MTVSGRIRLLDEAHGVGVCGRADEAI